MCYPIKVLQRSKTKRRRAWTPGKGAARQQRGSRGLSDWAPAENKNEPENTIFQTRKICHKYQCIIWKKNRNFQTWHRIFTHLKRWPHKTPYMGTFIFHEQKEFKVSEKLKILFRSKTKKPATNWDFEPKLKKRLHPHHQHHSNNFFSRFHKDGLPFLKLKAFLTWT